MSAWDELERLLEAERQRKPPAGAAEAARTRLDAALSSGAPALAVATGPLELGLTTIGKLMVIGATTLAVGSGGAVVATLADSRAPAHDIASARPALPPPPAVVAPSASSDGPRVPEAVAPIPSPGMSTRAPTFDEELRLIQLAKSELDAGRSHLAAVWLAEHRQRFPNGVFSTEREALALLVDCPRDPEASRTRAEAFVRKHRGSPMVDRVVRACGLATDLNAPPTPSPSATKEFPNGPDPGWEPKDNR